MGGYEVMARWARLIDLIRNRINVACEILGTRYHGSPDSPIVLADDGTGYRVEVCGGRLCRFGLYDLDGAESALREVDGLCSGLWNLRRGGVIELNM